VLSSVRVRIYRKLSRKRAKSDSHQYVEKKIKGPDKGSNKKGLGDPKNAAAKELEYAKERRVRV